MNVNTPVGVDVTCIEFHPAQSIDNCVAFNNVDVHEFVTNANADHSFTPINVTGTGAGHTDGSNFHEGVQVFPNCDGVRVGLGYVESVVGSHIDGVIPHIGAETGNNSIGHISDDVSSVNHIQVDGVLAHIGTGLEFDHLGAYHAVHNSGSPNYLECRIPVPSGLDINAWNRLLDGYHDDKITQYLEFGWPIGVLGHIPPSFHHIKNHSGARDFQSHVDSYISKELSFGATIGPFDTNPLVGQLHLSPLNTVPKGSTDRRVIVDLSCPKGGSVNDAIDKDLHEGERFELHYPSVDNLADRIKCLGAGCLAYKRDLSRAYRQIPVCPGDCRYLGFEWQGFTYIDRVLPFGLRSAAMICQRVTSAISHIVSCQGFTVINYLDDFGGAERPERAHSAFDCLGHVLGELGVVESLDKAQAPSTNMEFLGVAFDTIKLELSVTPQRLADTKLLVKGWLKKRAANRKEVESLAGTLQFISKCVKPGRLFLSRIFAFVRALPRGKNRITIPSEVKLDIRWWDRFLEDYNGVSIIGDILWSNPDSVFASDACLTGVGACTADEFWHKEFPSKLQDKGYSLNALELWGVVISAKIWGKFWSGQRIQVWCNNPVAVEGINSGNSKDLPTLSLLRELHYVAAACQFQIRALQAADEQSRLPDCLSRWHLDPKHRDNFRSLTDGANYSEVSVPPDVFKCALKW